MIYCYICHDITEEDFICDICDNYYCEECSYTYGLYYQFQGSRCYKCADQDRRNKITKNDIRNRKLDKILR